jgi:hypothetical protein
VTQAIDPSRPIIESSGYYHGVPNPDVLDAHDYDPNPTSFRKRNEQQEKTVPFVVSEYGGIGWNLSKGGFGWGDTPKDINAFYARYQGLTDVLLDNRYVCGYCYTQLTNIEQEQNGVYTYDRKPKFDVERLRKIQSRRAAYETDPPLK